jgi:hypothetical protein
MHLARHHPSYSVVPPNYAHHEIVITSEARDLLLIFAAESRSLGSLKASSW